MPSRCAAHEHAQLKRGCSRSILFTNWPRFDAGCALDAALAEANFNTPDAPRHVPTRDGWQFGQLETLSFS